MTDFIPGSDFVPGSDLVPGVTDLLGIDMPGISDLLGTDTGTDVPGVDPGGTDVPGTDNPWGGGQDNPFGPDTANGGDISNGADTGTDIPGTDNPYVPPPTGSDPSGTPKPPKPGTGGGTGKGNTTTNTTTNISNSTPATQPNLTGNTLSGSNTPMFDFTPNFSLPGMSNTTAQVGNMPQFAEGGLAEEGSPEGHNPEFYSEGGLQNRYVQGDGDGTSDSVPAMLANGEFVIPADVVSALGNGSSDSGASVLDNFLNSIREHKQTQGSDGLPPDSEGPLAYLSKAKNKAEK